MHLRIVEFQIPDAVGNLFFVEEGKRVWEVKTVFKIPFPRMVWNSLFRDIPLSAGETVKKKERIGHKTYEEAFNLVEELKKQIPIYHNIL